MIVVCISEWVDEETVDLCDDIVVQECLVLAEAIQQFLPIRSVDLRKVEGDRPKQADTVSPLVLVPLAEERSCKPMSPSQLGADRSCDGALAATGDTVEPKQTR